MFYVYLLRSLAYPDQIYIGRTLNLEERLSTHNAGKSPHTSKFKPWRLVTFVGFSDEMQAVNFEIYLKSGSGKSFALKRFL